MVPIFDGNSLTSAHVKRYLLFDLFKAFKQFESSHKSDIFIRKDQFFRPCYELSSNISTMDTIVLTIKKALTFPSQVLKLEISRRSLDFYNTSFNSFCCIFFFDFIYWCNIEKLIMLHFTPQSPDNILVLVIRLSHLRRVCFNSIVIVKYNGTLQSSLFVSNTNQPYYRYNYAIGISLYQHIYSTGVQRSCSEQ